MALDSKIKRDIQDHYDLNEEPLLTGWQQFNANEEISLKIKIGSILYSTKIESNEVENPSLLLHYCRIFSCEQREQIRNVFEKIRQKIPAPQEIYFGCTFLTLFEKNGFKKELLLFRCIQPSTEDVFFIEPNGRTYENWKDFVRSNKIQTGCEYFAPSDGVYSADKQICKIKRERINKHIKPALIFGGIGIILANVLSEAPVTSTILHMAVNIYGTFNCVSTMIDKHKHKEPITLSEYLTLFAICLTQLCSASVYYIKNIFEFNVFGVYWGEIALTFVVIGVLCWNTYILFKNVDNLWSNITDLRISDLFSLSFQAFLLYDQVQNAREIFKLLSKRSFNPYARRPEGRPHTQNLNSKKFTSTREAKMKNIMPERAENKAKADDGFQEHLYDSIDSIIERFYRRFGNKRKKKGFFSNFFDSLFDFAQSFFGGWFSGVFDLVRNLFF